MWTAEWLAWDTRWPLDAEFLTALRAATRPDTTYSRWWAARNLRTPRRWPAGACLRGRISGWPPAGRCTGPARAAARRWTVTGVVVHQDHAGHAADQRRCRHERRRAVAVNNQDVVAGRDASRCDTDAPAEAPGRKVHPRVARKPAGHRTRCCRTSQSSCRRPRAFVGQQIIGTVFLAPSVYCSCSGVDVRFCSSNWILVFSSLTAPISRPTRPL